MIKVLKVNGFAMVVLSVLAIATTRVSADGVHLTVSGSAYESGSGGEFAVSGFDTAALKTLYDLKLAPGDSRVVTGTNSFQTFCIETQETFSPGSTYSAVVNDRVIYDTASPLLSNKAAYLFEFWWTGDLLVKSAFSADYEYGGSVSQRSADAGQLQLALWALQYPDDYQITGNGTPFADGTKAKAWWQDATTANPLTPGRVKVLNLWDDGHIGAADGSGFEHQDQLVVVEAAKVPLPGAASGVFTLLAAAFFGRRVRRSA